MVMEEMSRLFMNVPLEEATKLEVYKLCLIIVDGKKSDHKFMQDPLEGLYSPGTENTQIQSSLRIHPLELLLMEKTGLKNYEFHSSIGWLARENKIYIDDDTYKIGETNLTDKIGSDAGVVWKILDIWGYVDISSISRLAQLEEKDVFCALGWLAREDKIDAKLIDKKENLVKYHLR